MAKTRRVDVEKLVAILNQIRDQKPVDPEKNWGDATQALCEALGPEIRKAFDEIKIWYG